MSPCKVLIPKGINWLVGVGVAYRTMVLQAKPLKRKETPVGKLYSWLPSSIGNKLGLCGMVLVEAQSVPRAHTRANSKEHARVSLAKGVTARCVPTTGEAEFIRILIYYGVII